MKLALGAASLAMLLAAAPAWAGANAPPLSSQDKKFVGMAEASNLGEAMLGQLAQTHAVTPAVKTYARWMATDASLANRELMQIAAGNGYTGQASPDRNFQDWKQRLASTRGIQYDQLYMKAATLDHRAAVPAFRNEAETGRNPALKAYATKMIPVLEQQLAGGRQLEGVGNRLSGGAPASGSTARPSGNR